MLYVSIINDNIVYMVDAVKQIDPNRALSVEGIAYIFFYLISRVERYKYMLARLNSLKLDPESKKYLNEHGWNFDDFKAPTPEHRIMAEAILAKDVKGANRYYANLKKCFIDQFGPFWGQVHLNSIFLDYSTRKIFIREKILETIASIASSPTKNKVIYFLNTGAGVDNSVQFVSELCQTLRIECRLIELDTPDMSKFKSELMGSSYPTITYIPCDISQKKDINAFRVAIEKLLEQDSGKNVSLINLSEGLTPYVSEENMSVFNEQLLKLSKKHGLELYQIIDSIVCDQSLDDQRLGIAKKYVGAFESIVKNEEEFIQRYGLGDSSEKYNVFHPASEVTISREYKTVMLLKLLELDPISCSESITIVHKELNKEQLVKELDEKELQVRKYYKELLKQDPKFIEQVEQAKKVLSQAELELKTEFGEKGYNDFELVAKFNNIYKKETKKEFLDTELAKSLFELSNACQSAKYLWNMTLAPKTESLVTPSTQTEAVLNSKSPDLAKALAERKKSEVRTELGVASTFVEKLTTRRKEETSIAPTLPTK